MIVTAVLTAPTAFGVFPTPPGGVIPPAPIASTGDVYSFLCVIIDWIFWLLIIFSIIMFLVGGYRYLTSGGESERVGKANKTLMYAAIGVAVAIIAAGVPYLIASFLGSPLGGSACFTPFF